MGVFFLVGICMSANVSMRATLDDLHTVEGKAERIGGKIIRFPPNGVWPSLIGGRIYQAIDDYAKTKGCGLALPGSVGFAVPELASGRESFCPDAAYYLG